jgi:hypothetical protein
LGQPGWYLKEDAVAELTRKAVAEKITIGRIIYESRRTT